MGPSQEPDESIRPHLPDHRDEVWAVASGHDGGAIASGSLGTVENLRLRDASGRWIATLPGHSRPVRAVAFAPDGRRLASAGNDRAVRAWDLARGRAEAVLAERDRVAAVAFYPDGSLPASADEGGIIRLRDPDTRATVRAVISGDREIRALAFAPEGDVLAAAGQFGSIRVWDPATGLPLLELKGATATQINALAFAPDGATLAAADHGGHALIHRAPHADPGPHGAAPQPR